MNLNDKIISSTLAQTRQSHGNAWQLRVLAEMARRKRRHRQRILAAAASAFVAIAVPWIYIKSTSTPNIYSDEYYASLPQQPLSIPDEINAIISDLESSKSYFEPYEPLPQ